MRLTRREIESLYLVLHNRFNNQTFLQELDEQVQKGMNPFDFKKRVMKHLKTAYRKLEDDVMMEGGGVADWEFSYRNTKDPKSEWVLLSTYSMTYEEAERFVPMLNASLEAALNRTLPKDTWKVEVRALNKNMVKTK